MGRQRRSGTAVERWDFQTAIDMGNALPHLFKPISDLPKLTEPEREALAQCKASVETLKLAFFAAGKALQIIRDARLYRATHSSFEAFVLDEFGMKRAYANKLIRTWRLAEYLIASEKLAPNWSQRKLNQGQLWELVEYAEAQSVETAALIYITVYEAEEVAVTAAVLNGAVAAVRKSGGGDPKSIQSAVLEYLATLDEEPDDDPFADFSHRIERAVPSKWVYRLGKKDPEAAHRYLDELQRQIDKCRTELPAPALIPAPAQPSLEAGSSDEVLQEATRD
ncbi:hypothetical protein [Streptomyces luteogriseus]|uniref:hypothetical protein n=1 Tax=Streptomyces luteogriseus TaxID=68233 RepID=UPI00378B8BC9